MVRTCKYCGSEFNSEEYVKCDIRSIMEIEHVCFTCGFWLEKLEQHNEHVFVTSDYVRNIGSIVDKTKVKGFLGCGGRDHFVKYNDARYEWYNNVWCQGFLPEQLRTLDKFKLLQPNCICISEEQYRSEYLNKIVSEFKHGQVICCYLKNGSEEILLFDKNKNCFYGYDKTNHCFDTTENHTISAFLKFKKSVIDCVADDYLVSDGRTIKEWRNQK